MPGACRTSPSRRTRISRTPANTVSRWAATTIAPRSAAPGRRARTLPLASSCASSPASRIRAATQAARSPSSPVGAGISQMAIASCTQRATSAGVAGSPPTALRA